MQHANPYIELCLEGQDSIFKKLNPKEKEIIAENHKAINTGKGEYVFHEGEKTRSIFFLAAGKIKLYKVGAGRREQILRMLKPGDFLGFTSMLNEKNWLFSAVAMTDSVICVLERSSMLKIFRKNADLSMKLAEMLGDDLLYSYNRIVSLTQKHVRARLVETLLTLVDTYGYEPDGKTLSASISRDDIAHFSNMTTSNAIRTLSELSSEGMLELAGRKIIIPDIELLKEISDAG